MPIFGLMKRKKSSIGCLFWIALVLLVLVIFLFNRKTIETVLENTGFWDIVSSGEEEPEINRLEDGEETQPPEKEVEAPSPAEPAAPAPQVKPEPAPEPEPEPEPTVVEVVPQQPVETPESTESSSPERQEGKLRRSRLYFIRIEPDGNIVLKGIVRPVYYQDSPLTETLINLLKGLSASEINQGLLSLIPEGTTLNGVSVRNGTAFLDFSEEFLFNSFGKEGYTAQLEQIVFSATEFSTVERVQILIGGQVREYMGSEGVYIGKPLGREDF